jgi:hypothetical protein
MEPLSHPSNKEELAVHVSQSFTLNSRSTSSIRVALNAADKVQGSFRICRAYGYGDKELKFKVLDTTETTRPSQAALLDLGTVVSDASFDFTADRSGDYVLVFDNKPNSPDSNSQKEIQLTYEISNPAITSRQDATPTA